MDSELAHFSLSTVLVSLKALEYGIFGFILGRLTQMRAPYHLFARSGFTVGLIFAAFIVTTTVLLGSVAPPIVKLVGTGVNELLFPIGCGTVIYTS